MDIKATTAGVYGRTLSVTGRYRLMPRQAGETGRIDKTGDLTRASNYALSLFKSRDEGHYFCNNVPMPTRLKWGIPHRRRAAWSHNCS